MKGQANYLSSDDFIYNSVLIPASVKEIYKEFKNEDGNLPMTQYPAADRHEVEYSLDRLTGEKAEMSKEEFSRRVKRIQERQSEGKYLVSKYYLSEMAL